MWSSIVIYVKYGIIIPRHVYRAVSEPSGRHELATHFAGKMATVDVATDADNKVNVLRTFIYFYSVSEGIYLWWMTCLSSMYIHTIV